MVKNKTDEDELHEAVLPSRSMTLVAARDDLQRTVYRAAYLSRDAPCLRRSQQRLSAPRDVEANDQLQSDAS